MNLAKECKAASEKLSKLDVCTSDVRYAIRILREAAETLEAAETPREQGECAARKALKALVARLDLVHEDERYKSVWMLDMIHGGNYTGPKYEDELNLAKSVLCQPCHSSMTREEAEKIVARVLDTVLERFHVGTDEVVAEACIADLLAENQSERRGE